MLELILNFTTCFMTDTWFCKLSCAWNLTFEDIENIRKVKADCLRQTKSPFCTGIFTVPMPCVVRVLWARQCVIQKLKTFAVKKVFIFVFSLRTSPSTSTWSTQTGRNFSEIRRSKHSGRAEFGSL